jgi:hypothetical protein
MLSWKNVRILAIALPLGGIACTTTTGGADAGQAQDSGPTKPVDAGPMDAGPVDAGPVDAGPELATVGIDGGSLTIVAAYQDYPSGISVQGSTVFWSSSDSPGAILSAPAAGGGTVTTIESMRVNPSAVVTDSTNVYWIDLGSFDNQGNYNDDGAILQAPLAGGNVTTIATGQDYPAALAVGGGKVYWANAAFDSQNMSPGSVVSNTIGGGTPSTLFTGRDYPTAIAVDANNLYWTDSGAQPTNSGYVLQAALGSTIISTLASMQDNPSAMAIDAHNVYWANQGDYDSNYNLMPMTGSTAEVPIGGSTVTTLATLQDNPIAMVTGNSLLYWANNSVTPAIGAQLGEIVQISTASSGATPVTIISGAYAPSGIALPASGNAIYFTDSGDLESATGYTPTSGVVFSFIP